MVKEWAAVLAVMLLPIGASGQTVVVDGDTLKLDGSESGSTASTRPSSPLGPLARDGLVAFIAGQPVDASRSTATATGAPSHAAMPAGRI
jgi:hypothetical protein